MNVGPHHTADDLVSATRAALAGGITTVIDLGDEPPPPPSDGLEIGWMTLAELTWVWAEGPAQRFGLAPRKGAIEPGADADLVAVDPAALVTRQDGDRGLRVSIADPRRCSEIRSAVRWVLRGGEVVVDDGQLLGDLTGGRFLALRPKQE
jgi:dihydroorotase-like cyclic amidohydrolase